MKKFEYKIEALCGSKEKIDSQLKKLGEQGWELVSIDRGSCLFAYFKRQKKLHFYLFKKNSKSLSLET